MFKERSHFKDVIRNNMLRTMETICKYIEKNSDVEGDLRHDANLYLENASQYEAQSDFSLLKKLVGYSFLRNIVKEHERQLYLYDNTL